MQVKCFWRSGDRASWKILIIKPTRSLISQICFWNETPHVSDSSSVHHQEFFAVHTEMVCHTGLLTACELDQDGTGSVLILLASCICNLHDKLLLCVQWKTADDAQKNCPKYIEFRSKNKFAKLVHLVGFIIRKKSNVVRFYWYFNPSSVYVSIILFLVTLLTEQLVP